METAIIIPTYNEQENIVPLIKKITAQPIPNLSIIVVDDNSPDGTGDRVREIGVSSSLQLISRPTKSGIGDAYRDGFEQALKHGTNIICQMDADFSHNPDDLPRLIDAMQHADCAIGSRKIPEGRITGWGPIRRGMSTSASLFARALLSLRTKDVTSGFRCFRRNVLEQIDLHTIHSNGYAFQTEMIFQTEKKGFCVAEIPVTFLDRKKGKSKLGKKDVIEFFSVMTRLWRYHRDNQKSVQVKNTQS